MRVAAFGRTEMLMRTIHALRAAGHEISIIGTCRAAPEYTTVEADFAQLAATLGVAFFETQNINRPETIELLRASNSDVAVSVNWISLVGQETCASFPHGVLNAHAGDLPKYRGNAPVAWAILRGESEVGLSIHRMDPTGFDTGDIYAKRYLPLTDGTYVADVFEWLEDVVPAMFADVVTGIENATVVATAQPSDPALALHGYPRRPEDGRIRWDRDAVDIARLVRASAEPFDGAFTEFEGRRLTIWRAHTEPFAVPAAAVPGQVIARDRSTGFVSVAAADEMVILREVQLEGDGRALPFSILRSLRDRLG